MLPNVKNLVANIQFHVEKDVEASQIKEAAVAPKDLTVPIARELLKFAHLIRREAVTPVTFADVHAFADKVMEQQ